MSIPITVCFQEGVDLSYSVRYNVRKGVVKDDYNDNNEFSQEYLLFSREYG